MSDQFPFDVRLSLSYKDETVVRAVAERSGKGVLEAWFDEWVIKPKALRAARKKKFEKGLEHYWMLLLSMSINAFGSDWALLEAATLWFWVPLNEEHRFIPLRLCKFPQGLLNQFLYINWLPADCEQKPTNAVKISRRNWSLFIEGLLAQALLSGRIPAYVIER
jgi:hypothetical protein